MMGLHVSKARTVWWLGLAAVAIVTAGPALVESAARAQGWQFPWSQPEVRRERPRPDPTPQPVPGYGQPGFGDRPAICLQLEQRLAQEANRGANSQTAIAELSERLRNARNNLRRTERDLDRSECYESFLFTRSLRNSRQCITLDRQLRDTQAEVAQLTDELRRYESPGDRGYQDEIIRALARNNCGTVYNREARRRDPWQNFWQDGESDGPVRGNTFGGLPFATYRTVCVRLCDGYYFPVSFSTLPTHFPRDAEICQSKCAAPAELYFHQNPGGSVDQMVSQTSQQPYTKLKTAFRYRKEYVPGCSCKASEYVPQDGRQFATPTPPPSASADGRNNRPSPIR